MRSDGLENRRRILAAAEVVFGAKGVSGSTEEVAARAGVGVGTVFRHFPTKAELLSATLTMRLEDLDRRAAALAEEDVEGASFERFFYELVQTAPTKLAIAEALSAAEGGGGSQFSAPEPLNAGRRLMRAIGSLLAAAQAQGRVRRDLDAREAFALMIGVSRGAVFLRLDTNATIRLVDLTLEGLREG